MPGLFLVMITMVTHKLIGGFGDAIEFIEQ